jgi:hypothetical protein
MAIRIYICHIINGDSYLSDSMVFQKKKMVVMMFLLAMAKLTNKYSVSNNIINFVQI